jgi:UDP-N-acetyl-D-mannosaminuronate dehydrogenase
LPPSRTAIAAHFGLANFPVAYCGLKIITSLARNIYIVTVPTPINEYKQPDLSPLERASSLLGQVIKQGDIVIYESTVYPGLYAYRL